MAGVTTYSGVSTGSGVSNGSGVSGGAGISQASSNVIPITVYTPNNTTPGIPTEPSRPNLAAS